MLLFMGHGTMNVLYLIIKAFNLTHNSKTELVQWLGDGELWEDVDGGRERVLVG
jgi:hypothetical protein